MVDVDKAAVLAVLAAVIVYWIRVQRPREEEKKRKRQMEADFPDIIAKLTVLIGAGLSLPQAWLRLAQDYEKKREAGKRRWAYEELCVTARQLQNVVSAGRAFGEFGRRTGIHAYIKLGSLLEQNMKKGTRGLYEMLQAEAYQAFEERKHQVRRAGEEVSTRLLIPMFMMFGVVLIVILVPALMSFSF